MKSELQVAIEALQREVEKVELELKRLERRMTKVVDGKEKGGGKNG